jgi:thiol-disulfide isomerase/thioredoxin
MTRLALLLLTFSMLGAAHATEAHEAPRVLTNQAPLVGRQLADLSGTDLRGETHRLSEATNYKALVIFTTSTSCPVCKKFAPALARIEESYAAKGIAFCYLNLSEDETAKDMWVDVKRHDFDGPYIRDPEGLLGQALGVCSTTEAFVIDATRTLRYRGAVSDQYGIGYALDAPRKTYLTDALDAILAGAVITIPATTAPGCELDFAPAQQELGSVTYHNRISRILDDRCVSCHRDGGVAPFTLTSYEAVKDHRSVMKRVLTKGQMPPWFAAPGHIPFSNDLSINPADKKALLTWLDSAMPIGDPRDAPVPRTFNPNWVIGEPDLVVSLPKPVKVKAEGSMPYVNIDVDLNLDTDRWVQAVEIRPGVREVVHHALVFAKEPRGERTRPRDVDDPAERASLAWRQGTTGRGGFFAGYVPGNSHFSYPEGMAKRLPAGAKLHFQLHYTPIGTAVEDQTQLGIIFADGPPEKEVYNYPISQPRIRIPPGEGNHMESRQITIPGNIHLLSMMPHMHLRGKAFRYELTPPQQQDPTILLDVPAYDFNWQLAYHFVEPYAVRRGSQLKVTGWFDNSADNPANPDPAKEVRWGKQTEDEMLIGYVEFYVD